MVQWMGKDRMFVMTPLYPGYPQPKVLCTQALDCSLKRSPPLWTTLKFCCHFVPLIKSLLYQVATKMTLQPSGLLQFKLLLSLLGLTTNKTIQIENWRMVGHLVIYSYLQLCKIYKIKCATYVHYIKIRQHSKKRETSINSLNPPHM